MILLETDYMLRQLVLLVMLHTKQLASQLTLLNQHIVLQLAMLIQAQEQIQLVLHRYLITLVALIKLNLALKMEHS